MEPTRRPALCDHGTAARGSFGTLDRSVAFEAKASMFYVETEGVWEAAGGIAIPTQSIPSRVAHVRGVQSDSRVHRIRFRLGHRLADTTLVRGTNDREAFGPVGEHGLLGRSCRKDGDSYSSRGRRPHTRLCSGHDGRE